MMTATRSANQRRRNLYMAAAVTLVALTFVFAPGEEGMLWMMWRDATWLAILLLALAAVFVVLWRRTPRT
jgi:hypothetical protein